MNNITAEEAEKIIKNHEAVLIDVRTPQEFENGHIPGAKNIDIYNDSFDEKIRQLDMSKSYIVNCQSGGRSSKAVEMMGKLGFKNVKNLEGGFTAWEKSGFPTDIN